MNECKPEIRPFAAPLSEEELTSTWQGESESPLLTVKCITYNHGPFVRDALNGILNQRTTFPFRVVVHDDASTDDTQDIVRDYAQRYPQILRCILQETNLRSRGLSREPYVDPLLAGAYHALCEGDDYWTRSDKLQRQVDFLKSHPDYSFVFHSAHQLRQETKDSYPRFSAEDRTYSADDLLMNWIVPTASMVFRVEALKDGRPKDSRFRYGDKVLQLTLAGAGKVFGMKEFMSVYRRHEGGFMETQGRLPQYELQLLIIAHYLAMKEHFGSLAGTALNRRLSKLNLQSFFMFREIGFGKRLGHLAKAIRYDPSFVSGKIGRGLKKRLRVKRQK